MARRLHDEIRTRRLTRAGRDDFSQVPGSSPNNYTVDHSTGSYVFDPEGRLRLFIRHGQGPEPIAHDLKQLLS